MSKLQKRLKINRAATIEYNVPFLAFPGNIAYAYRNERHLIIFASIWRASEFFEYSACAATEMDDTRDVSVWFLYTYPRDICIF